MFITEIRIDNSLELEKRLDADELLSKHCYRMKVRFFQKKKNAQRSVNFGIEKRNVEMNVEQNDKRTITVVFSFRVRGLTLCTFDGTRCKEKKKKRIMRLPFHDTNIMLYLYTMIYIHVQNANIRCSLQ